MDVEHEDHDLERLELEADFDGGRPPGIVRAFRSRLQLIRQAVDEREFYGLKSLHFERLKGRSGERSMRLNLQWRLILRIKEEGDSKTVVIVGIEDYH